MGKLEKLQCRKPMIIVVMEEKELKIEEKRKMKVKPDCKQINHHPNLSQFVIVRLSENRIWVLKKKVEKI